MAKIKLLALTFCSLLMLTIAMAPAVLAVTAPVEFVIPDTKLVVTGQASPGALVSIFDNNILIGTTLAGNNAQFSKSFVALDSGIHNLRIEFIDKAGRKSTSIKDTVSVAFQKETAVEYFLPPTFEIAPSSLVAGEIVTFQGSTVPGAVVRISVDGGNTLLQPQADSNGNYSISMATDGFFFGLHPTSASAKFAGKTSYSTDKKSFEVLPGENQFGPSEQSGNLNPPIIISPESGFSTDDPNLLINGSAAPNQQIIIFLDGQPIGSTFSNSEGLWFFNIQLVDAKHKIQAITCVDNECSNFSEVVEIEFTGDLGVCKNVIFSLDDYRFWGIYTGGSINLSVNQLSGQAPYTINIDWGNGLTEQFSQSDKQSFIIHHIFRNTGKFNGVITITDNSDCAYNRYFTVDVETKKLTIIDFWWTLPALLTVGFALTLRYKKIREV